MKKKGTRYVARRLWSYIGNYRAKMLVAGALMLASHLLLLLVPLLSGEAIDAIGIRAGGVNFPAVFRYCLLMLACYAVSSALSYVLSVSLIRMSQDISAK